MLIGSCFGFHGYVLRDLNPLKSMAIGNFDCKMCFKINARKVLRVFNIFLNMYIIVVHTV